MADTSRAFITRVISGLLAAGVLLSVGIYGGTRGLLLVCTVAAVLAVREFARMAFSRWNMPEPVTYAFWFISLTCYAGMYLQPERALLWFTCAGVALIASVLWLSRGKVSNENLLAALALGGFGLLYCVLFPYFGVRIVQLENGDRWFLFLLLLVFFGDTFAYFGGRWFGGAKLMPMVSPNKTWSGAAGGLVGSAAGGSVVLMSLFDDISVPKTVLFCLICGAAAQSGDLVMSLVKRVAQVKDSGSIMPGHGGVLDRLDGVFIACPLVYAFAMYFTPF